MLKKRNKCNDFIDDKRLEICNAFYGMGDLALQREYITRHVTNKEKKKNTRQE